MSNIKVSLTHFSSLEELHEFIDLMQPHNTWKIMTHPGDLIMVRREGDLFLAIVNAYDDWRKIEITIFGPGMADGKDTHARAIDVAGWVTKDLLDAFKNSCRENSGKDVYRSLNWMLKEHYVEETKRIMESRLETLSKSSAQ